MKRISIRTKIIGLLLGLTVLTTGLLVTLAREISSASILQSQSVVLQGMLDDHVAMFEFYTDSFASELKLESHLKAAVLPDLLRSYRELEEALADSQLVDTRARLLAYYRELEPELEGEHAQTLLPESRAGLLLQQGYLLDDWDPRAEAYRVIAQRVDDHIARHVLGETRFYDLLLVAPDGQVVFSRKKEIDLGTDLLDGPYAKTAAGQLLARLLASPGGRDVRYSDVTPYPPSRQDQAVFVGTALGDPAQAPVGYALGQIDLSALVGFDDNELEDSVMDYLAGPDRRLRFSRLQQDELMLDSPAVDRALAGERGLVEQRSPWGRETLAAFAPVQFGIHRWALVVEADRDQVMAASNRTFFWILFAIPLVLLLVGLVLHWALRGLFVRPLDELMIAKRRIESGDYSHRIQLDRRDEFGDLAQGLNRMAEAVQAAFERSDRDRSTLESAKERLEVQVHSRTSELARARDEAEAASRAKSKFLANVTHEIRTPMTAILGFAQLLRYKGGLSEAQKQDLQQITDGGDRLLRLLDQAIEVARLDAQKVKVERIVFDLGSLLRRLERRFEQAARARKLGFEINVRDKLAPRYRGDAAKLAEVLYQLIDNAIKYTHQGGVLVRVEDSGADGENVGNWLKIRVEDTGPGIDAEIRQDVFRAFEQAVQGAEAAGGTGLGLAIVQQYVQLLGGILRLNSGPDSGTQIDIELPLEAVTGDPERAQRRQDGVLLVGCDGELVADLKAAFGARAGELCFADSAEEALDEVRGTVPLKVMINLDSEVGWDRGLLEALAHTDSGLGKQVLLFSDRPLQLSKKLDLPEELYYRLIPRAAVEDQALRVLGLDEPGASPAADRRHADPVAQLAELSQGLREQMQRQANAGDIDGLEAMAQRIQDQSPAVARWLEICLKEFDYAAIASAMERVEVES